MDYKFDCDKFCKTFNVKQDKSIDSLRLTHNQDIHFRDFRKLSVNIYFVSFLQGLKYH